MHKMTNVSTATVLVSMVLLSFGPLQAADSWLLDDALRQAEKATKGVKALTADVEVTDIEDGETKMTATGKAQISFQGQMRLDLQGDDVATILCTPQQLFIHYPDRMTVEQYKLAKHEDRLAQYALLGFQPRGSELKKEFLVTLLEEESLEGRKVLLLELTPKAEDVREAVSRIHLWIDQSTWLPVRQRIYHGSSDVRLIVTYDNISRDDSLSQKVFKPKWPKGTAKVQP
jgi:outer membrane lipoprotein-sorting protein